MRVSLVYVGIQQMHENSLENARVYLQAGKARAWEILHWATPRFISLCSITHLVCKLCS